MCARVEARPPPLLVARLAARAAEALCRLCRGQGLEGAYAPAPEWELARAQVGGWGVCLEREWVRVTMQSASANTKADASCAGSEGVWVAQLESTVVGARAQRYE